MSNPHQVTRDFEKALCEYTGAPFAVAVNSCTMALLLAVKWHIQAGAIGMVKEGDGVDFSFRMGVKPWIEIPKRTYVSVPQSIIHAGGKPIFRDQDWIGMYRLEPLPVYDSARFFSSGMYGRGSMVCLSFHSSKTLGDTQGGAILHDNPEADAWFRRARFDGRTEGVAPKDDTFREIGYHCYLSPDVAARLLLKLSVLPKHNEPLPNDQYPDLSQIEVFK